MAYEQENDLFELGLKKVNSIIGNKAETIKKCLFENKIVRFRSQKSLETWVEDLNKEIELLQNELKKLNSDEVKLTAQEKSLEEKERGLIADKKKTEIKEESLKGEMRSLNNKIDETKEKIKAEEKRREFAPLSLVPGYDLISGIIDNDPMRIIPGYSLVIVLISFLFQEKEKLERARSRLERELSEADGHLKQVSRELEGIEREKSKISNELSVIRNRIGIIGDEIKKRGRDLTESGNVLKELKISQNKFALDRNDLFMIRECVDNDFFEKDIFNDFTRQFRDDNQQNILPIICLILSFSCISFYFK